VIDDGSTDGTRKIVQSFGDSVSYHFQVNAGADRAYNHGISLARGEFIAFLDHDDRWYPHKLETQLAIFTRHLEVGLTYSEVDVIDEQGRPVKKKTWAQRRGINQDLIGDTTLLLKRRMPVSVPAAMLFRRDLLVNIGGFDCGLPRGGGHADGKLCVLAGETSKVYFSLKPLVQYRMHPQQMTHLKRQALHQHRIDYLDSLWTRWRDRPDYRTLLLPLYGRYWSKEGRRACERADFDSAWKYLRAALTYRPFCLRTWFWLANTKLRELRAPSPRPTMGSD
jgi:glycosyltransferase involved in cell wall biosynthesis